MPCGGAPVHPQCPCGGSSPEALCQGGRQYFAAARGAPIPPKMRSGVCERHGATVERGKPRGMHPRSNLSKVGGVCVSRTGSKEKRYTCSHGDRTRLSQTWRSLPRASHNHGDTLQPQRRCFKYPQTPGRAKGSRHRPGRGKGGISPARRE